MRSIVFDALDQYLTLMDKAPVGENSVFQNDRKKEKHESILMYAFRKYRAAFYHLENVNRMLSVEFSVSDSGNLFESELLPKGATAKISGRRTADHFIYELAAFFEAAKSSLDFLATAVNCYLSGINTDSIRTLIRCVDRETRSGSVFNVVKRHLSWLKQMREYRHHLVHRMIITASTGYEVHKHGQLVRHVKHPVVVPESTPSYFPDTRRSRTIEEEPFGLDYAWSEGKVKYLNGTEEIVELSAEYTPSKGYAEISSFMALHLNSLENFFCDIIAIMKDMNFKKAMTQKSNANKANSVDAKSRVTDKQRSAT